MKTLFLNTLRLPLLAACVGLGTTLPAVAQATGSRPQPVCIDQVGPFSYHVRVSNPGRSRGEVRLVSLRNNAILHQYYNNNLVFGQCLNVRELPDGEYTLLVKLGNRAYNYTLDIHSNHDRTARLGSVSTVAVAAAN